MKQNTHKLKLPSSILGEIEQPNNADGSSKFRLHISARKELRKAERKKRTSIHHGLPPQKRVKSHINDSRDREYHVQNTLLHNASLDKSSSRRQPKPDLDNERHISSPISSPERSNSRIKNFEEDREIAELERKLGLKKSKKTPQSFKDDGLDDLLGDLNTGDDSDAVERDTTKTEGDQWLKNKRQLAQKAQLKVQKELTREKESTRTLSLSRSKTERKLTTSGESNLGFDTIADEHIQIKQESTDLFRTKKDEIDSDSISGFDSEDMLDKSRPARLRENPYVPPKDPSHIEMYKPPSLRKIDIHNSEDLVRLRRRVQGLINRITESNLISILGEIENLYRLHPRQDVTSTLTDILLESVCVPTSLPDTLIILPAGLITAIYKVIGTDFGAEIIQRIVSLWDEYYARAIAFRSSNPGSETSKETSNLIMLIAMIYIFQVVGSNLLFDYIRFILGELTELNAELLLKIIRTCGPQLRQDDPSSLKDVVVMVRAARTKLKEQEISVRTKFMIDTIIDLKNNRMKTGGANSAIISSHIIQMKKILGTLSNRTIKAMEPLRIGLKDIHDSDKKGKWWLVGASWSGHNKDVESALGPSDDGRATLPSQDTEITDLMRLAREQRMNTDVRRAIFFAIMSASDYQEAYAHLEKLRLKKSQEYEIPKVLIRCIAAENSYNPYYTLIARKLCNIRKLKISFQYCLWDLFKRMDDSQANDSYSNAEDEEDEEKILNSRVLINLAKMYGNLVTHGSLGLDILRNLNHDNNNWAYLPSQIKMFLEIFFITIFVGSSLSPPGQGNTLALPLQKKSSTTAYERRDERVIISYFAKIKKSSTSTSALPTSLIVGLESFLKLVSKTDLAAGSEKETVQWACKVARNFLKNLLS
ncbi:Suppressor of glycerol defect protein 1 [Erysiphe neolycopersici]|uniref:Suppressor of glycerol defect protein 1 n=1 Tax=Erysiphe neolycopersici TaxID=212602 RepID=A0A420I0H5_9PEZI|nr:Suppressor of glycerol defect protein 1 [Erysiphe neolycopersici]